MVFPVVMYGCESWTVKKAEHRRIDAFELWCWRRLLRVPWTARRSKHSILKEIQPFHSKGDQSLVFIERLMLKLKLQYFGHLMWRVDSMEKTLMLGGIRGRRKGDDRGWDGWMASPTGWIWVWVNSGSWWWTGRPGVLRFMGLQRVRYDWVTELSLNWVWHNFTGKPAQDDLKSWGMLEWWKMGKRKKTDSDGCQRGKWTMRWESQCAYSGMSNSCDPIDFGQPGFWVHRIVQSRLLEQIAISYSRESSQPRDQMPFPTIGHLCNPEIELASLASAALTGRFFINPTTWEARGKQQREDGILFFFWPWGMPDLNSPTKDRSHAPCSGSKKS